MAGERDIDLGVTIRSFGAGQKLFGRYTLVRALGRGGMGVVWLARDSELERDVALKFLPEMVAADPVAIDDLKHETRRSLELTHPNIVRVHDFIQENGIAAISMEFVNGRTLAEVRLDRANRAFDVSDLSGWLQQICEALHYAHVHARVVHRDLKPANVMLDDRNRIKLTDFGISATVSDTVTRVSRVATTGGTAAYASPQQLMGEPPSPADDVYALGATLYELLTSRPPFFTGNLLLQVQNKVPPPMEERRRELDIAGASIPSRWEEVIAAALAKNPDDRPPTIEAFALRLDVTGSFPPAHRANGGVQDHSLTSAATIISRGPPPAPGKTTDSPPPVPMPSSGGTKQPVRSETSPPLPSREREPVADVEPPPPAVSKSPAEPVLPRRKSRVGWLLLVLLLVVIGAGLWFADVPNRVLAAQRMKEGQRAIVVSDYGEAVQSFRDALLKRPADPSIRTALDDAQQRWMSQLKSRIDGASAREVLEQLQAAAQGAGAWLIEPEASEFRRLLRDAEVALRDETERGVRREIEAAMRKADDGDVAAALADLETVGQQGILLDEIEAARKGAAGRAVRANTTRIAEAIETNNAAALESVIQRTTGKSAGEVDTAAARVLAARDPRTFLAAIEGAGMQLGPGTFDTLPTDLALVEASRNRFADTEATKHFLAGRYVEAAHSFLENGLPGFALYAEKLARAEGGGVDQILQREAREALINEFDFTLHLAETKRAGSGADSAVPVSAPRKALHDVLQSRVGKWMKVVELAPLGSADAILVQTGISELTMKDEAVRSELTVRYRAGSRMEPNPEYQRTSDELEDARRQLSNYENQLSRLERGGDSRTEAVLRGIAEIGLRTSIAQTRQRVVELTEQRKNTPRQLEVAVEATEPYQQIEHKITYRAIFDAKPVFRSRDSGSGMLWSAETRHETTEVTGNASRGVPVRSAEYPEKSTVAGILAGEIAKRIAEDSEPLLRALMLTTFLRLDAILTEVSASPAAVADRRWGLLTLWQDSGLVVPQAAELERAVREQLGLAALPASRDAVVASTVADDDGVALSKPPPKIERAYATYVVKQGDTVRSIASALRVTPAALVAANPGIGQRRLRPGQVLLVPPRDGG